MGRPANPKYLGTMGYERHRIIPENQPPYDIYIQKDLYYAKLIELGVAFVEPVIPDPPHVSWWSWLFYG